MCVRVYGVCEYRCMFSLLRMFMHAHTVETLEIHGCRCQGLWPAAADEILSGSTDLCSITESLTEVLLNRDEETMRFLDKVC